MIGLAGVSMALVFGACKNFVSMKKNCMFAYVCHMCMMRDPGLRDDLQTSSVDYKAIALNWVEEEMDLY